MKNCSHIFVNHLLAIDRYRLLLDYNKILKDLLQNSLKNIFYSNNLTYIFCYKL